MRIDKYLWCIRYYKTRNIATQACNRGQITLNNQKTKPSKNIISGDIITVKKNQITFTLKVLDIPKSRVGAKLVDLYRIDTTPPEELEKLKLIRQASNYYREKGIGRPTKKDRRDIDSFTNPWEEDEDWDEL